jgi:hypothetical protein
MWQEVLNRLARLLTPEQVEVISLNLSDRSSLRRSSSPAAQKRWARRRVMSDYGAALAELNLPTGVLSEAKDLLLKRSIAPLAVASEARERGEDPRSDQTKEAQRAAVDSVNADLKALLGVAEYQRLEHLHEILPIERSMDFNEIIDCRAAGCSLTPDQVRSLSEASWEVRKSLPPRKPGDLREDVDPATGLTARAAATLARSGAFLSPAQQEVLKTGFRDLAAAMNRIADSQPPPPKRYPPQSADSGKGS